MAISNNVKYAVDLAKKNSLALSFIPIPRLVEYDRLGQLLVETENDEACGFLVYGAGFPVLKVYQACIQYDARRRDHALSLVKRLVRIADAKGCQAISLWCANDLEANAFWKAAGFVFAGQRAGGKARGRIHNQWVLSIGPSLWDRGYSGVEGDDSAAE